MNKIVLSVIVIVTLVYCVSSEAIITDEEIIKLGINEETFRFFCEPTYWTPHCPIVCRLFPQFCEPPTTTSAPPTETTTGPPKVPVNCIQSCEGMANDKYPGAGSNCQFYRICTDGVMSEGECPTEQRFDPVTKVCVSNTEVDCYTCPPPTSEPTTVLPTNES